jgi:hypothetical protein
MPTGDLFPAWLTWKCLHDKLIIKEQPDLFKAGL